MKKWLTLLLALIVFTSAVIPCCPQDNCQSEVTTSTDDGHPFDETGACSPFFACGSCTGFTSLTKNVQVPSVIITHIIHQERDINLLPSTYTSNLFQPPRSVQYI